MLDPEMRRYVTARRTLNAILEAFVTWHRDQLRALNLHHDDPLYWAQRFGELSPAQLAEINELNARLPYTDDVVAIQNIISRLGEFPQLAMEDALYLADSRSKMLNALYRLRDGDLRGAFECADDSRKRLTWLVHGRKRETVRTGRHPSVETMSELDDVIVQMDEVIDALKRGAAA